MKTAWRGEVSGDVLKVSELMLSELQAAYCELFFFPEKRRNVSQSLWLVRLLRVVVKNWTLEQAGLYQSSWLVCLFQNWACCRCQTLSFWIPINEANLNFLTIKSYSSYSLLLIIRADCKTWKRHYFLLCGLILCYFLYTQAFSCLKFLISSIFPSANFFFKLIWMFL